MYISNLIWKYSNYLYIRAMENDIVLQRFKEVRLEQHLTQTEFAQKLGIGNTTADIERGRTKLSGETIKELLKQFGINPLWIYGESNQKRLNLTQLNTVPKVISVDSQGQENMTLVNQHASAGYPQNIRETGWHQQLPAFQLPLPQFKNATYRGFQIEGDSMEPHFHTGEWVLAKAIDNIEHANDGKVYVVVTEDSVLIKKLHKIPQSKTTIKLISLNSEYAPFEVALQDIQELWQVNSKLTFSVDTPTESHLLQELKASMKELKEELKQFKKPQAKI